MAEEEEEELRLLHTRVGIGARAVLYADVC
jgi:hypothetical protein